ncbi:MAG: membrane integrity-associated transporter subunit PqiC [Desulfovibrio sp.]|nr:membrane integrity-associated transporter subunit PqiC [Desulfovibrio sp.]
MKTSLSIILLLSLLAVALCACGRSTPTKYYLLESSLGAMNATSLPAKTLRVAQVEGPAYLNRNNIVSRVRGETQLILAEFHLWAEPVNNGVRRVVEETLTGPMLKQGVNVLPSATEEHGDYVLLIDLQRLDGNFNEKAVLESRWALLDRQDKRLGGGIYSAEEMVPGASYDLLVGAESSLVRNFGKYLAGELPSLMR